MVIRTWSTSVLPCQSRCWIRLILSETCVALCQLTSRPKWIDSAPVSTRRKLRFSVWRGNGKSLPVSVSTLPAPLVR